MNIPLTLTATQLQGFEDLRATYNTTAPAPLTLEQYGAQVLTGIIDTQVDALKRQQREAMIPVADEILLAPPDKQAAAIQAALAVVRA